MTLPRGRLWPLWALIAAYALILGVRWTALPHDLIIRFSALDAPLRSLPRAGFAVLTLAILCAAAAVVTSLLPHEGECSRGAATAAYGFAYGMIGFLAGVFWSLVRINAALASEVRPAVATALGCAALGLVLGVSARAPLPRRVRVAVVPDRSDGVNN